MGRKLLEGVAQIGKRSPLNLVRLAAQAFDDEVVFVAAEGDGVEDVLIYGHVFRIRGA